MTRAPIPMAILAALVPTTPPPSTTTVAGENTGNPTEKHTASPLVFFKIVSTDLSRHSAGYLTHGREQGGS